MKPQARLQDALWDVLPTCGDARPLRVLKRVPRAGGAAPSEHTVHTSRPHNIWLLSEAQPRVRPGRASLSFLRGGLRMPPPSQGTAWLPLAAPRAPGRSSGPFVRELCSSLSHRPRRPRCTQTPGSSSVVSESHSLHRFPGEGRCWDLVPVCRENPTRRRHRAVLGRTPRGEGEGRGLYFAGNRRLWSGVQRAPLFVTGPWV